MLTMSERIRVALADDHPCLRAGIRATLEATADMVVVGEAADGHAAQQVCQERRPAVLVLDLRMPGPSALETIAVVQDHSPTTRVMVLSAYRDAIYVRTLLARGIAGYLLKEADRAMVIAAIRTVARGGVWFSPAIAARVVALAQGGPLTAPTARELEVLTAVAQGWTDEQIAAELTIMKCTVRFHLKKVFARLGVDGRVTAVLKAIQVGWIEPPQV